MQRSTLQRAVLTGFGILGLGFALVLFMSLGNQTQHKDPQLFSDLISGQTSKRRLNGVRVWVSQLNTQQHESLGPNHPCENLEFCIISAEGSASGLDLVYSLRPPPQLTSAHPWVGGFVDPSSGDLFDLAGRAVGSTTSANRKIIAFP